MMKSLNPSIEALPGNIMADVLSRLPVKTIIHCKCVCKNWRELVSDSYFVNLHISRLPAGVMIHENCHFEVKPGIMKWLEIKGEVDDTRLHHDFVTLFDLSLAPAFQNSNICQMGSVNGLICLWKYASNHDNIYICNPITREYMILPRQQYHTEKSYAAIYYSFGVGLLTKEYNKVMRIFQPSQAQNLEVYTLGTGQWRRVGHVPYLLNESYGPYVNGCAHWIFCGRDSPKELYAFDFDNETFSFFPSPPSEEIIGRQILGVINGCNIRFRIHGLGDEGIWDQKILA
ncbi:F-box domain-containing protein [Artemisia annua]|uniref:F-box domain-containing protein n=1 Tax=Artemisia annua TaxID=35608 RepID=A0A2U1M382_ARTAN|nr:F-box domain-containing protein [Artemisia annua]